MAQAVQTGRGGKASRAADGQLGVDQREVRAEVLIHDAGLLAVDHHYCKHADLAAGACYRGREHQRAAAVGDLAHADIFLKAAGIRDENGGRLCDIHSRTAAESENALATVCAVSFERLVNIFNGRIGQAAAVFNKFNAVCPCVIENHVDYAELLERVVGNKQALLYAELIQMRTELFYHTVADNKACGTFKIYFFHISS